MIRRSCSSFEKLSLVCMVAIASVALTPAETIYDMIPSPYPGSFPSLGYQATSTDEFGDHIAFGGIDRDLYNVVVSLTNWACENDFVDLGGGAWGPGRGPTDPCISTPGSGYMHPITLNIYEVDTTGVDPAVGPLITTKTGSYFIPFRPSWDPMGPCTPPAADVPFGGTWFDPVLGFCVHGYAFNIVFDFSADGIVLPDEVIYGVAYNTHTHGAAPIGAPGPYSSLNFSVDTVPPTIGTDAEPGTAFWDTSVAGFYCDGGAGGTDTFRRDAGCWTTGPPDDDPYTPVVQFNTPPIGACCTDGPGSMSDCLEVTEAECQGQGGTFIGPGIPCLNVLDCVPLSVELEQFSAMKTPRGVAIRWTTVTEVDTMGFRLLRESGSREKALTVVAPLIPAAGSGLVGASYEFLDNVRQDTSRVRYYLEDIDVYGRVTRHGPFEVEAGRSAANRN